MEEILASIRRIIADDDATKTASEPAKPAPPQAAEPAAPKLDPGASNSQDDIDALFAKMEEPQADAAEPPTDILDLTEAMERAPSPQPSPPPPPQSSAPPLPAPSSAPPSRESSPAARSTFRTIDGESDVVFDEACRSTVSPLATT